MRRDRRQGLRVDPDRAVLDVDSFAGEADKASVHTGREGQGGPPDATVAQGVGPESLDNPAGR